MIAAAVILLTGCGKQEKTEGTSLANALAAKQANAAEADRIEAEIVSNARAWCAAIVAGGSGRGVEVEQNASIASALSKSAVAASAELSAIRQAAEAETLQAEFPRKVRSNLVTALQKRQRLLQDIRAMLDDAATQFRGYGQSRAYTGDTYPEGIAKLGAMLEAYKPPENAVGTALGALSEKYNLGLARPVPART